MIEHQGKGDEMAIIINNLETPKDIDDYKNWMSTKGTNHLRKICKMIEIDEKYRSGRWKNAQLRIKLLKTEIYSRSL